MLRRWRVVVIDDNPEGSLEAVLLSPLVISQPLPIDASREQIAAAVANNRLNSYLPLEDGETYAQTADVDFQIRGFAARRAACAPRYPIVEVERDFARAWQLAGELAEDPPDIIFLDVMFDQKTTPTRELEAIIDEIQRSDRIGQSGRATVRDLLGRGGLFLLGRLLRSREHMHRMPLIVLYTASREVQTDFRPFEYASDGRFEVVEKRFLRNNSERRKQVFRRRIRDYFMDGTVRPDDVRAAVDLLATPEALRGDRATLVAAFSRPIGSGWCFGTMFVAESVAYLSSEPGRRHLVIEDLEHFIAPLVSDARSFVDLMESSPARLFSHADPVTFSRRPWWLAPEPGQPVAGNGRVRVSLATLNGALSEVRDALEGAVGRLPVTLREALGAALRKSDTTNSSAALDTFIASLRGYNQRWEELLLKCRMRMPVSDITSFLAESAADQLELETAGNALSPRAFDLGEKLELLLSPSDLMVKEPLASLLRSILNGMRGHAYHAGSAPRRVSFQYTTQKSPSALQLEIRDEGAGFPDLRYYDPHGRGGDLSTALIAAAEWFDVEIHSGGIRRRPTAKGSGQVEPSPVTTGTSFVIRIPAYRLEES